MSIQAKKILTWTLKIGIFGLIVYFIFKVLRSNAGLRDFKSLLDTVSPEVVYGSILLMVLMMLLNWFIESLKWKFLCQPFQKISIVQAILSVLCGLSWAVFTPNRIGEYGGRVLFLKPRKRILGVVSMGVGAFAQLVVTNTIGVISIVWFTEGHVGRWLWFLIMAVAFFYGIFFLIVYFNIGIFHRLLLKIRFLQKYRRFFDILLSYDRKDLTRLFLYSLARYLVFTAQYSFLMQIFIPEMPFWEMLMTIPILFFVQSALPSLDLFDVGVRGLTAGFFFGFITNQEIAVMAVAASVWFVNLIMPAIIGSILVFRINFFGGNNH